MRFYITISFCIIFAACHNTKTYDNSEFDKLSKQNETIIPNGTYVSENRIDNFNIPVLYIDSPELRMEFLDSNEKKVMAMGAWTKQSFDTQLFSFNWPFNRAIFSADGIYFLDSFSSHFFEKTADSIVPLSIPDSLNLKK